MRWLHELGRDLQKVAINRDGVWPSLGYTKRHAKAGVSPAQYASRDWPLCTGSSRSSALPTNWSTKPCLRRFGYSTKVGAK